jgi:hypothetical protein
MRLALLTCVLAVACSTAQQGQMTSALDTPPGQLFCKLQTNGGGALIVAVVNVAVSAYAAPVAPMAVIATGATKATVDQACNQAGGVPVPPPPDPASAPKVLVSVS